MTETLSLIEKLEGGCPLNLEELTGLVQNWENVDVRTLRAKAGAACEKHYGRDVYLRGLIEVSNYCKNDCFYCGIRKSNGLVKRYRLTEEQILACCERGYELGLRTFVLQGGEDSWFNDERVCAIVRAIKDNWPDCAVTLSLGERSRESYAALRKAGADRYLLRHETADADHYTVLHPPELSLENRMDCLRNPKELGYQVGTGFMVGSPGQTLRTVAMDLLFLQEFRPHMAGIGPFIPHKDTPFAGRVVGTAEFTLFLLSVVRLLLPAVLLPATTALGTVAGNGWELGMLAGANVIMPNLTPPAERSHYRLYDNKQSAVAEDIDALRERMAAIGRRVAVSR